MRKLTRAVVLIVTVLIATVVAAPAAHASTNPYNPYVLCGAGFTVRVSEPLARFGDPSLAATFYLLYNATRNLFCGVTIKSRFVGVATETMAGVGGISGTIVTNSGPGPEPRRGTGSVVGWLARLDRGQVSRQEEVTVAAPEQLDAAVGGWAGTNLLRLMPTDSYRESEAHASVARAAGGDVVVINYTWAEAGEPQDGMLIIGGGDEAGEARAVWVDSWHQRPQWMALSGAADEAGVVRLGAPYAEGFEWRINVDATTADTLAITMDNAAPGQALYQVVEARYTRKT